MKEIFAVGLLIVGIVLASLYSGFLYGRAHERAWFIPLYEKAIEQTYWDGFNDGQGSCERHYAVRQGSSL